MTPYQKGCGLLAQAIDLPKAKALERVQQAQYIFRKLHAWPEFWKTRLIESRLLINPPENGADENAIPTEEEEKDIAEAAHFNNLEAGATGN